MEWTVQTSKKEKASAKQPKVTMPSSPAKVVAAPQQKIKINMARQSCNYCKGMGHRIHAMDEFGAYLMGEDGTRILACPKLVVKQPLNQELPPTTCGKWDYPEDPNWREAEEESRQEEEMEWLEIDECKKLEQEYNRRLARRQLMTKEEVERDEEDEEDERDDAMWREMNAASFR